MAEIWGVRSPDDIVTLELQGNIVLSNFALLEMTMEFVRRLGGGGGGEPGELIEMLDSAERELAERLHADDRVLEQRLWLIRAVRDAMAAASGRELRWLGPDCGVLDVAAAARAAARSPSARLLSSVKSLVEELKDACLRTIEGECDARDSGLCSGLLFVAVAVERYLLDTVGGEQPV